MIMLAHYGQIKWLDYVIIVRHYEQILMLAIVKWALWPWLDILNKLIVGISDRGWIL